jgi:hypothetical protein
MAPVVTLIEGFLSEGYENMCQELIDAIGQIGLSIEAMAQASRDCCMSGCGPGSAGAGLTETSETGFTDDGQSYPDGFDSYQEYDAYKCDVAHFIVASLVTDLQALLVMDAVALIAPALALSLVTPIPFDDLVLLAALCVVYLLGGLLAGYINNLISELTTNESVYVCALYNGANESTSRFDFLDEIDSATGSPEKLIIGYMLKYDILTYLYSKVPVVMAGGQDCSSCDPVDPCYWIQKQSPVLGSGAGWIECGGYYHAPIPSYLTEVDFRLDGGATRCDRSFTDIIQTGGSPPVSSGNWGAGTTIITVTAAGSVVAYVDVAAITFPLVCALLFIDSSQGSVDYRFEWEL